MAASDHLGAQFHVEDDVLHVGGRPYPFAKQAGANMPEEMVAQGYRSFDIPFESGHSLRVFGRFNGPGNSTHNLSAAGVRHEPTDQLMEWNGEPSANPMGPSGRGLESAEHFHELVRHVSSWKGGSKNAS